MPLSSPRARAMDEGVSCLVEGYFGADLRKRYAAASRCRAETCQSSWVGLDTDGGNLDVVLRWLGNVVGHSGDQSAVCADQRDGRLGGLGADEVDDEVERFLVERLEIRLSVDRLDTPGAQNIKIGGVLAVPQT